MGCIGFTGYIRVILGTCGRGIYGGRASRSYSSFLGVLIDQGDMSRGGQYRHGQWIQGLGCSTSADTRLMSVN